MEDISTPIYNPKENDIIYHYCNAEAFLAICTNQTLRYSDINSMNDSLEMQWGIDLWEELKKEAKEKYPQEVIDKIDYTVKGGRNILRSTACCFSLNGDLLSQWRAYSDDGSGFAIGFDSKILNDNLLNAIPLKVLYDKDLQKGHLQSTFLKALNSHLFEEQAFYQHCMALLIQLTGYKNPAFREESEVRFVVLGGIKTEMGLNKIVFGHFDKNLGKNVIVPVSFKIRNNIPVPFVDLKFSKEGIKSPVKEIIIGPKNQSTESQIKLFIDTIGLGPVKIRKSNASYR